MRLQLRPLADGDAVHDRVAHRAVAALARVQAGQTPSWAALAQDLGWFDQPHFIADFRRLVGCTPGEYARGLLRG